MKKEERDIFDTEEIESIELLGERETIDICVEDTHMFYANDIYTHNSGFNVDYADEQNIGKAIEVYQVADLMVMLTQSLPMLEIGECNIQLLKNRLGRKGVMLRCSYDPNLGLFEEIEEINRSMLVNKKDRESMISSIGNIREKIQKIKEKTN